MPRALEVLLAFLRLGCISFGGPVAHLGYFRTEFVERRKWLDEATYGELIGLCQFLPGPASSQVGFSIGLLRAGLLGGLAAWVGFTTPSALLMLGFALGLNWFKNPIGGGVLVSLMIVAIAVVAQAIWNLGRRLCPDRTRISVATVAAAIVLFAPWPVMQIVVIGLAAIAGHWIVNVAVTNTAINIQSPVRPVVAGIALVLFAGLLAVALRTPGHLMSDFYRAGALVFGGGHVVLPMLQDFVAEPRHFPSDTFLAGYGAAQALPGPLFTFSAYLGARLNPGAEVLGAAAALVSIFLPGLLLVVGVFPFWVRLRRSPSAQTALAAVNAAVVGLLFVALVRLLWGVGFIDGPHLAYIVIVFLLLEIWHAPVGAVVIGAAAVGALQRWLG